MRAVSRHVTSTYFVYRLAADTGVRELRDLVRCLELGRVVRELQFVRSERSHSFACDSRTFCFV